MYIHRAFVAVGVHAPDFVHQLAAGEDLHRTGQQLEQQEELLLGQVQQRIAPADGQAVVIQYRIADGQAMAGHGPTAAQQSLHMQKQLVQINGLGEVIIRACGEACALVLQSIAGSNQHNGQKGIGISKLLSQLPTVHDGHHDISYHQVGHDAFDSIQCFFSIGGRNGLIAIQPQKGTHHPLQRQIIFNNHDGEHLYQLLCMVPL